MIVLSNVGNRDLQMREAITFAEPLTLQSPFGSRTGEIRELSGLDEGVLPSRAMREVGEYLLTHEQEYENAFEFEILECVLEEVEKGSEPISLIVLYVTDQQGEKHRSTDTLHIGAIFKRFFESWKQNPARINIWDETRVEMRRYTGNPADYDEARNFFHQEMEAWCKQNTNENYFVNVTGGTQQMNTMLMMKAAEFLAPSVQFVYKTELKREASKLDVGRSMYLNDLLKSVRDVMQGYDYWAAWRLLDVNRGRFQDQKTVSYLKALLNCAHHRYLFDFTAAERCLNEAIRTAPKEDSDQLNKWKQELRSLKNSRCIEQLLGELVVQIELQWQRQDLIGLLGRMFRFVEEVYKELLIRRGASESQLRNENRKSLKVMLSRYNEPEVALLIRYLERFDKLAGLRNKSILAHGFIGLSVKKMANEYMVSEGEIGERLLADLFATYTCVFPDKPKPTNSFEVINDWLIERFDRLRAKL